jgi:hypothetical protein
MGKMSVFQPLFFPLFFCLMCRFFSSANHSPVLPARPVSFVIVLSCIHLTPTCPMYKSYHAIIWDQSYSNPLSTSPIPLRKPPPHSPPHNPRPDALPTIQLGPHIQIKAQRGPIPTMPIGIPAPLTRGPVPRSSLIKVNDIFDLLPTTPLHHPIMAVKGDLVAQESVPARAGGERVEGVEELGVGC